MIERRRVGNALVHRQAACRQRIAERGNGHVALGPPQTLRLEGFEIGRGQAGDEHLVQVDRLPPARVEFHRRVEIFGDRLRHDAAERRERFATKHRTSSAEERGVPVVLPGHHQLEERVLFAVHAPLTPTDLVLHRVQVVVLLWRLDEGHLRIAEEAERALEELGPRHVVGVEARDEIGVGEGERVVPVAGLGVGVVGAGDIVRAQLLRHRANGRSASVIQHVRAMRVPHANGRSHSRAQQVDIFVEGRDEDINLQVFHGLDDSASTSRPRRVEVERQREEAVQFREVHQQREHESIVVDGVARAIRKVGEVDRQSADDGHSSEPSTSRRLV